MATILIQPDSLSLSSNLKKFEIAASSQVRFKLALGGSYIIDETYSPNAAGRVVIDIKDVVKEHLTLALPSSDIFQQSGIVKTFSAEIDSLPAVSFTVIRAGVENLSDTPSNFLTANWLTWQSQTKQAGYYQPEWLTYYAPVAAVIKVKFYLKDDSTATVTLHSPAAGTCYTYNMQFSYIMSLQAGEKYGYYDVWAENVSGERLTYIQRYVYREQEDADEFFVFENSLGGLDTAVMNGESIFSPEMEHAEGLYDDISQQLDGSVTRLFEKNTGWKSKPEADWLFDFFNSHSRYKVADGTLRRITIKESSVSDSSQEDLKSFTFVYRLAQDLGLLNVPRTMDPPPANLEILTPEGLFFLAPRLNEFPSAELDPTLIFPVQSPYSEVWRKISWAGMYSQLYGQILDSPVGQLAHGHDNYSVLSLLADVGGKLYYNGSELGGSGGTTGTNDHDKLINRNKAGQHPISAIAGLDAALLSKAYISGSMSQDFAARRLRSHTLLLPTDTPDLLEGEYALTVLSTGFSGETPGGGSGIGYMRDLQDVTFENLTDDHAPVYVSAISKFQNKRVSLYGHTHTEYALKAGDLNQDFSARRLKSRTLLIPTSDTLDLQTGEYALTILASGFSGETPSGGAAINVLSDVGDVQLTDLADYQVLMRYSNNWVNRTLLKSHIADFPTTWAWSALSGIPTTFTPAAHTHTKSQITDFPTNLLTSASLTPGYLPYWNGSAVVNSIIKEVNGNILIGYESNPSNYNFAVSGSGYFNTSLTSPFFYGKVVANTDEDYAFQAIGHNPNGNLIAIFGQSGITNGFTISYNGSRMVYDYLSGDMTVDGYGFFTGDGMFKDALNGGVEILRHISNSTVINALWANNSPKALSLNLNQASVLVGYSFDSAPVSAKFQVNGSGYFNGTLTVSGNSFINGIVISNRFQAYTYGDYGVFVAGTNSTGNPIALFGQVGVTNGFTISYNGSRMVYDFLSGDMTVDGYGFFTGDGMFKDALNGGVEILRHISNSTVINALWANNSPKALSLNLNQASVLVGYSSDSAPVSARFQVNGSGYYNSHLTANGRLKSNTLLIPSGTPELQAGEYALTVLSSGFSGENPPAGAINVLSDVGDVTLADLADYQVLMRVAGNWVNRALLKAHIADFPTTWAWSALSGIPTTFTPAAHTHTKSQISDFAHNHDGLYMPIAPADDSISASKILQSTTRRFVTDSEKSAWSAKWDYNENTIKAVKVNSAADSDKLLSHTLYDLTYHSIYNPSNGLLITTDIPASSEAMFSIEITGNGYSGENLNATFSGYWSNSAATFYTLKGFSAGGVTAISSFVSNGFLCFHVQPSVTFQTYRVWVSCESRKNRVILLYNAAKPAGRTSEQNTTLNIMRHSGNFRAGLEYQTPIAAGTYAPFTHYHDYLSIYGGTVAGAINVTDSTSATSSTTGALRVAGGISTQNNLHVGNELVAAKMRIPKWNSFSPPTGLQSGQYYLYIIE